MNFRKPKRADLPEIYEVLSQWNQQPYLEELFEVIKDESAPKEKIT